MASCSRRSATRAPVVVVGSMRVALHHVAYELAQHPLDLRFHGTREPEAGQRLHVHALVRLQDLERIRG